MRQVLTSWRLSSPASSQRASPSATGSWSCRPPWLRSAWLRASSRSSWSWSSSLPYPTAPSDGRPCLGRDRFPATPPTGSAAVTLVAPAKAPASLDCRVCLGLATCSAHPVWHIETSRCILRQADFLVFVRRLPSSCIFASPKCGRGNSAASRRRCCRMYDAARFEAPAAAYRCFSASSSRTRDR